MALKAFRSDFPEIGRSCVTTIIELPIDSEKMFVPQGEEIIESISISPVEGHKDMVAIAFILSTPIKKDTNDA